MQTQEYYVSERTLNNRKLLGLELFQYSDLPIEKRYIDCISSVSDIVTKSKWLNAVTMYLDKDQMDRIKNFSFVKRIEVVNTHTTLAGLDEFKEYPALAQVNSEALRKEKLSGRNVPIGIIDGRFTYANKNLSLNEIFKENRVLGAKDFVSSDTTNFFNPKDNPNDWHGTAVWLFIAGEDLQNKIRIGMAPDASFYLARTDDTDKEFRKEEDYWIAAMEWMDSLGVRLINTSLGYSIDFTNPDENYKLSEMDGRTSAIAKAAHIATHEKGMIVVVSAGNDGENNNWKIISTPADTEGVISVGAMDSNNQKHDISGIGPDFLTYIKPDVACFSEHGTSAAAPIITGLIACMLQRDSTLTSLAIVEILKKSAHLYPYGNNFIGFGAPNAARVLKLMINSEYNFKRAQTIETSESSIIIKTKKTEDVATAFHKSDSRTVLSQEVLVPIKNEITIERPEEVKYSTLSLGDRVVEIFWKQEE